MGDEKQATPGGYPANIDNPDDWAAFLARYLDNRATNAVHNGIGLVALHIADAIRDARRDAEAADRITALTGRLAELERATPEEVVEMAARARHRANEKEGHKMPVWETLPPEMRDAKLRIERAVTEAIAAPLRAQERLEALRDAERECEEIGEKFGTQELTVVGAAGMCATRIRKLIAARIRAGGSGG